MIRIWITIFNVALFGLLVYHLIRLQSLNIEPSRRRISTVIGIVLLLMPTTMLIQIIPFSMLYFFMYPLAIALFLYLTWDARPK